MSFLASNCQSWVVNKLDITKIKDKYCDNCQHDYAPKMIINLLFYGYCIGLRSSRKIAKACEDRLILYILQAI
ncbi:MAG: hypothetical protein DRN66_04285 [Candidatus Nanohalarchaeota archaeon]|nr:MAG: hypothetical protein DRN66_04285 [Candidatus Nanohaloarchaeota archaeon]